MSCNQCGDCCRVIAMRHGPEAIRAFLIDGLGRETPGAIDTIVNAAFILDRWREVDRATASAIFPEYVAVYAGSDERFYTCDAWDPATKLCAAHEDRPPVCRDFPWYGREEGDHWLHPAYATCGYRQARTDLIALRRKNGEPIELGWGER